MKEDLLIFESSYLDSLVEQSQDLLYVRDEEMDEFLQNELFKNDEEIFSIKDIDPSINNETKKI